jgi:hypothetical protein
MKLIQLRSGYIPLLLLVVGCASQRVDQTSTLSPGATGWWVREELYFGSDIPAGGMVTDSLWEDFVDQEVVARFPDGFTTVPAVGRYKYQTGEIKKEETRIIILYYSRADEHAPLRVEQIIDAYKRKFSQESVLRVRSKAEARFR